MSNAINEWKRINMFQTSETTQHYLKKCYHELMVEDAETKSYENCYPYIYYLEQAESFYEQAKNSPISIKPVLLFYGLIHLIKACILTVDPNYPNSTTVLAHGVSTRKRKKRHYRFIYDEIKVQKNGLCTHFSEQMFHVKHLEGEKYKMIELLSLVVELHDTFMFIDGSSPVIPLIKEHSKWYIPSEIENCYHIGTSRLKSLLDEKSSSEINWQPETNNQLLCFEIENKNIGPPFRHHIDNHLLYLPKNNTTTMILPDLLVHYLILYNLSMISRYETEWWIDLIKTTPNADYPYIKSFLEITERKGPIMVTEYLFGKKFLHEGASG